MAISSHPSLSTYICSSLSACPMIQTVPVVILCGGDGLRFAGGDSHDTKVLAPIGGVPIVRHVMDCYVRYGFERFILCVKDSDSQIQSYVDADGSGLNITVARTRDRTPCPVASRSCLRPKVLFESRVSPPTKTSCVLG